MSGLQMSPVPLSPAPAYSLSPLEEYLEAHLTAFQSEIAPASHFLEPTERANILGRLFREAQTLRRVLRTTVSHINALSFVANFPPEILGMIFSILVDVDPHRRRKLGWIRVTHVCRLWRESALQTASLWSRELGTQSRSAFPVFLQRAGSHIPLRFSILPEDHNGSITLLMNDTNFVGSLREESSRIASLEWAAFGEERVLARPLLDDHPFHALRHLRLEHRGAAHVEETLASRVLHLPSLRSLHVYNTFPLVDAPCLTSLTMTGHSVDAFVLFRTLKECPLLENILIITGSVDFDHSEHTAIIELSHLTHLELHVRVDSGDVIHRFLRRLVVPDTACFTIYRLRLEDADDLAPIETAFDMAAKKDEELALAFMSQTMCLYTLERVDALDVPKVALTYSLVQPALFKNVLSTGRIDEYLQRIIHLSLWPSTDYTAEDWRMIFRHTPEVKTLTFAPHLPHGPVSLKAVFEALGTRPDEETQSCLLPSLASITLQQDVRPSMVSLRNDVIPCLQARVGAGALQLQGLFLETFDEDVAIAEVLLRSLVDTVIWKKL